MSAYMVVARNVYPRSEENLPETALGSGVGLRAAVRLRRRSSLGQSDLR